MCLFVLRVHCCSEYDLNDCDSFHRYSQKFILKSLEPHLLAPSLCVSLVLDDALSIFPTGQQSVAKV